MLAAPGIRLTRMIPPTPNTELKFQCQGKEGAGRPGIFVFHSLTLHLSSASWGVNEAFGVSHAIALQR